MKRLCLSCGELVPSEDMRLEADGHRVCAKCYLADPPKADVDGVLSAIAARARLDYAVAEMRAHSRMIEGVCDSCGSRTCGGGCSYGCR